MRVAHELRYPRFFRTSLEVPALRHELSHGGAQSRKRLSGERLLTYSDALHFSTLCFRVGGRTKRG